MATLVVWLVLPAEERRPRRRELGALWGLALVYLVWWVWLFPDKAAAKVFAEAPRAGRAPASGLGRVLADVYTQVFAPVGYERWWNRVPVDWCGSSSWPWWPSCARGLALPARGRPRGASFIAAGRVPCPCPCPGSASDVYRLGCSRLPVAVAAAAAAARSKRTHGCSRAVLVVASGWLPCSCRRRRGVRRLLLRDVAQPRGAGLARRLRASWPRAVLGPARGARARPRGLEAHRSGAPRGVTYFVQRAKSFAWYVRMMSAPARAMDTSVSRAMRSSSIHPRAAAAFTIAYSPETL